MGRRGLSPVAAVTGTGRPASRPARPGDLARLGPLYEQAGFGARLAGVVGFVPETAYVTLSGPTLPRAATGAMVRAGRAADLEAVLALDREATGEDRRRLLTALWPTGGLVAAVDGHPHGYHLASPWRPGGATIAADSGTGLALLDAVRVAPGDEVAISVPAANAAAVGWLEAAGFNERYRTIRMYRGPRVAWDPAALFAAHNLFWG